MSVDEVAVLRAAGLESAAKVIESARAGQVAAQPPAAPEALAAPVPTPAPVAPEIPAAPLVPAPVAAAERGPQPPAGRVPLTSIADVDALSRDEMVARMDEIEAVERAGS
jgi:hypothetical protein